MSRAFRDTFQQTFCICKQTDRRQSNNSFTQTKYRKTQSAIYETVATFKCPDVDGTSLTPSIKSLSDNSNKKRTLITLKFFNHTNSTLS